MFARYFVVIFLFLPVPIGFAQEQAGGSQAQPTQSAGAPAAMDDSVYAHPRLLVKQGKYDEALAELQDLQAKKPYLKGLSHELGTVYYSKADYPKAIEYLKKAQQDDPADDEAVQLLGLSYYLSGRPAEAIPELERVQTWYSQANVDAAYILGVCYIQTKNYPQARKAFAKMFDVSPDSAASYLLAARMLLRQQFEPIAEEYAHKAIQLDPRLAGAHFLLGELYLFKSRIPEAISELQKEVAMNSSYAAAYYKLADAYSRTQKYEDAERLLQRSIWLDSTATGPYILMGKVLEKKGEFELALRSLQRAAAMDPNNPMTHHLLGQTYRALGRTPDAERELHEAERLQQQQSANQ